MDTSVSPGPYSKDPCAGCLQRSSPNLVRLIAHMRAHARTHTYLQEKGKNQLVHGILKGSTVYHPL